jgi:hypothetical protein
MQWLHIKPFDKAIVAGTPHSGQKVIQCPAFMRFDIAINPSKQTGLSGRSPHLTPLNCTTPRHRKV